jgi:hypothetical protein
VTAEAAFYCVADQRYFLGAVALINSLRLVGHAEPIHVLDCGLDGPGRERIAGEATVTELDTRISPLLLEAVAPLRHPAEVMVLIDADMIVTRPLDELMRAASERGGVAAIEHGTDRFVPEWGELLGLGSLRRRTYVSGGLLTLASPLGLEVLELMASLQERVDFERTFWRRNEPDYPFLYGDQDVLNAILAARASPEQVVAIDRRLEAIPPFEGLRVADPRALRCVYADGSEPLLLHHYGTKPWLEETPEGPYSRLLRRLLTGGDVAIRIPDSELPFHLRRGYRPRVRRNRASGRNRFESFISEPVVSGIRALARPLGRG